MKIFANKTFPALNIISLRQIPKSRITRSTGMSLFKAFVANCQIYTNQLTFHHVLIMHSFDQYLLKTYYVSGPVLGDMDAVVNKTDKSPHTHGTNLLVDLINDKQKYNVIPGSDE